MKRGSFNSPKFHASLHNSKITLKYNALLEDYLDLQREYVSKKKKIEEEKQKREVLLDEVRFLRQRHLHLMKSQCAKVEPELGPHQIADTNDLPIRKERNHFVKKSNIVQESNRSLKELVWKTPSIGKKKPMNEKKSGKRIKVTLKV
ncbi:hypothetical protein Lal_00044696 [Lupinus albus]|uniref:Uncharacterized protein n=1 Tax=Lupinus albus TaxID=3870 RepID=A0A6A5LG63_LUPAL|nr:hypothetical protein Lalb_Chr24g0401951 [Lupinus albus]KAF1858663.1 hypothetical protein Lal_00044696 [Lupinus albus]